MVPPLPILVPTTTTTITRSIDDSPDNDDDPFGVFGEEEEEEDDDLVRNKKQTESIRISQSLVNLANKKNAAEISNISSTINDSITTTTIKPDVKIITSSSTNNAITTQQQLSIRSSAVPASDVTNDKLLMNELLDIPWKEQHPPLYIGPIRIVTSLDQYGGGRGCVASTDLAPGTLLLVEEPILSWSVENNKLSVSTIDVILDHTNALAIIHSIEFFHPLKQILDKYFPTDELSEDVLDDEIDTGTSDKEQIIKMIKSLHNQYPLDDTNVTNLLRKASEKSFTNFNGTPITRIDLFRILLALRYNGLESGMYLYSAMWNHADQPNCVKFLPQQSKNYSEIRTTRNILIGEPLTISYVPTILCHASRRKYLWDQHKFDIGGLCEVTLQKMELVNNQMPKSVIFKYDEQSTTHRIELSIAELNTMYKESLSVAEQNRMNGSSTAAISKHNNDNLTNTDLFFDQCIALEQAAAELCDEAANQLKNNMHILLIPCYQLHLDTCDLVQRQQHTTLKSSVRIQLLQRMIITARKLIPLQELFHGPHHFDLARSYLDLAQCIEELLTKSSKHLLYIPGNGDDLKSVSAWAALENKARTEYSRIEKLYPRNAEKYLYA